MDVKELIYRKKYFLFDLDGTLVDLEDLNFNSFKGTVKKFFERELTYDEYLKYFSGIGSRAGFESYSKEFGKAEDNIVEIVKHWQKDYRETKRFQLHNNFENVVSVIDGVEEFFKKLKSENKYIALGTSNAKEFSTYILERTNLIKYFDCIVTVDDVKNTKPNPEIYLTAMKNVNGNIQDSLIFEDSPNGIQCAKNTTIDYVVVHTKGKNDIAIINEKYVIENYLDI